MLATLKGTLSGWGWGEKPRMEGVRILFQKTGEIQTGMSTCLALSLCLCLSVGGAGHMALGSRMGWSLPWWGGDG